MMHERGQIARVGAVDKTARFPKLTFISKTSKLPTNLTLEVSMKRLWIMGGFAVLAVLAGCGGNKSYVKKGEINKTLDQQAIQSRYIETIGIGAADSTLTNTTQRRATSRDAAIVQAQYEMLSIVKGVEVEGGYTVEKAVETNSSLETKIKDSIKGAEVVKTEWTNDDGCLVTLRLDKKRLESQMGVKFK
jgi:hypothetical protein